MQLGAHIYKKRLMLKGRANRGSARSIILYQADEKAFLVYGYTKKEKANISSEELSGLKLLAKEMLSYTEVDIKRLIDLNKLFEVDYEK